METRLLTFQANLDASRLAEQIPPVCRAGSSEGLSWEPGPDRVLKFSLNLGPDLLQRACQIIPCFSCASTGDYGYRFTMVARTAQGGTATCSLSPVGRGAGEPGAGPPEGPVRSQIDVFEVLEPLAYATLELSVFPEEAQDLTGSPALLAVSVSSGDCPPDTEAAPWPSSARVDIPVPARSQMLQDPEIARRICSGTSVSMVLAHYGIQAAPADVARLTYHSQHDLYGIWPAGVYAASRWGMLGYLLRFPSWGAARWLLDRRVPFIASVRFEEGELTGAAIPRTRGHLLVVRGYSSDAVAVNDPAAESLEGVPRLYSRKEFTKVWLGQSGAGYVLFPARGA